VGHGPFGFAPRFDVLGSGMKILFVSVEVAPFAKVGGLADVAGALPKALRKLGHDARVIMPSYRMIEEDPRWELSTRLESVSVPLGYLGNKRASYKEIEHEGVPIGLIGTDQWYTESINSETIYQPGGVQHLFFSRAILQILEQIDWIPDVIHCNDWHTGFLPVLLREQAGTAWDQVASIYTIHNLAYQGEFGMEILDLMDLPHCLYNPEGVEAWGRVNFLKAGCVYADRVNTVSENYAREIQTSEFGCHLDGLMTHLGHLGSLSGILNGLDTDTFNPQTDPDIPDHFSELNLEGKGACRAKLLQELNMETIPGAPVFGVVSRLSSQKGMDLILQAADAMFSLPVQLVIQGLGDPNLTEAFRDLEKRYPAHFRFINRFDAPIAQRVYAGCDGFLMPSTFEPCGLGQMIAMRYGTVPVVRSTGGLSDTVFEGRNGFAFQRREPMQLLASVARAKEAYNSPERWKNLMLNGMRGDYTWDKSALQYLELYQAAINDRTMSDAKSA